MKKIRIKTIEDSTKYRGYIKIYAVDENDELIFGAEVELINDKHERKGWMINWAGCGAKTYEDKLAEFKVIQAGMKRLEELDENKNDK